MLPGSARLRPDEVLQLPGDCVFRSCRVPAAIARALVRRVLPGRAGIMVMLGFAAWITAIVLPNRPEHLRVGPWSSYSQVLESPPAR